MSRELIHEIHRLFTSTDPHYSVEAIAREVGLTKNKVSGLIFRERARPGGLAFERRAVPENIAQAAPAIRTSPPRSVVRAKPAEDETPAPKLIIKPRNLKCTFALTYSRRGPEECGQDTRGHPKYCEKHQLLMYSRKLIAEEAEEAA